MNDAEMDRLDDLLGTPDLASALGSDAFKSFLDALPVAIAVSELEPTETIAYVNAEFERLVGEMESTVIGAVWATLPGRSDDPAKRPLGKAITEGSDRLGGFVVSEAEDARGFDAWSNLIENDDGKAVYRLVALVENDRSSGGARRELEEAVEEKDALLRELQHRVKNNLQMITTLIRVESRKMPDDASGERVDRLAGRIESLALLYQSLADADRDGPIDLGVYLSAIASAVMRAHAAEGIRLQMQVDTWPVSINVAMPTGLVVNEVLTNALKHAFIGRDGGTIALKSLVDEQGCEVVVADDGVGLPEGSTWPQPGKMGALMVRSLRQNAKALFEVQSDPGKGTRVRMFFARTDAVAEPADRQSS